MERKIKVDQSHCNFVLSNYLSEDGWKILFRDAGRVSRGLSGSQEVCLGVFERFAIAIPDIVAVKNNVLLLVEVDVNPWTNESSFSDYKKNNNLIISELASGAVINSAVDKIELGFCKVGKLKDPTLLMNKLSVNLVAYFDNPMLPTLLWHN